MSMAFKNTNVFQITGHEPSDESTKFILYKTRFLMLAIFCFGSAMSNFSYCQYSIISNVVVLYYNVTPLAASWTTIIMGVGFIVGAVPGILLFQKFGLRVTLLIGMVGTLTGFWIECGAINRDRFWLVMIGQGLIAVFQPAFLNASPFIAYKWFGKHEVSKACSVAAMSNVIGSALSSVMVPSVVTSDDIQTIQHQMYWLFFVQAGVFTLGTIFSIIVFRERPPTPPSLVQAKIEESIDNGDVQDTRQMFKDMIKIMKNKDFLLVTFSYSTVYGSWTALLALINQIILNIYPSATKDVGYLALLFQFAGCIAMFLFGMLLDKTRKYKEISISVYFGMTAAICIFGAIYTQNMISVYIVFIICGFFMTGFIAMGMELAVEVTYPIPEITSSTCIIIFGNIGTLILLHLCQWVLTDYGDQPTIQTFLFFSITGLFTLGIANIDLRRMKAEGK